MTTNNLANIQNETPRKDIFGAHLLKGAEYDLECGWDIPYVDTPIDLEYPKKLIGYKNAQNCTSKNDAYLHFYHHDYVFDGMFGVWSSLIFNKGFKKGFKLDKLSGYKTIITPDFSLYCDMPRIMQMWNLFRSRVVGYYLTKLGFNIVVNVRWTDIKSYEYCFAGLRQNQMVAVSSLGCLRSNADKQMFLQGLEELIVRINPKVIILYGSLNSAIQSLFEKYNQSFLFFPSEISEVYRRKKNGNESK